MDGGIQERVEALRREIADLEEAESGLLADAQTAPCGNERSRETGREAEGNSGRVQSLTLRALQLLPPLTPPLKSQAPDRPHDEKYKQGSQCSLHPNLVWPLSSNRGDQKDDHGKLECRCNWMMHAHLLTYPRRYLPAKHRSSATDRAAGWRCPRFS
jgi:hypothetical protein